MTCLHRWTAQFAERQCSQNIALLSHIVLTFLATDLSDLLQMNNTHFLGYVQNATLTST